MHLGSEYSLGMLVSRGTKGERRSIGVDDSGGV